MEAGGGRLEVEMPEMLFEVLIEDSFMEAGAEWKRGE